jgi:hypothetical protein
MKQLKGEKYIYFLMAYKIAKQEGGACRIGKDSGYKGGQMFERSFSIQEYKGKTYIHEHKTGANFADYTRSVEIFGAESEKPTIYEGINESGENMFKTWTH